jgi:hypothetical protein
VPTSPTAPDFAAWARQVRQIHRALVELKPSAAAVGLGSPAGEEWFDLLERKLLPQLGVPPMLVVAVVGGTNIGKSVIFNHLAGETASRATPLAAGTRHPVCLVPRGYAGQTELDQSFAGFSVRPWRSPDDPLVDCPEHLLFWREGTHTPPRLLLLDTPDIDSDAAVNWERADHIRQAADVLVAVLTQQKYNDAAVKRFFRAAVEADKPLVVVFNQVHLEEDRDYWPQWLARFTSETGARPDLVYVAPYDRAAAAELRLPFYEVGPEGRDGPSAPAVLRDELAALKFDEIKIRTFRGALAEVLSPERGAACYLERIRRASGEFAAAAGVLSAKDMARVSWPAVPSALLVDEIRRWWDDRRHPLSRRVHGAYRSVGQFVARGVRKIATSLLPESIDRMAAFQHQEREVVVATVGKLLDELERLAQVGNDTLRPRLARILSGDARRRLLERVEAAHAELPAVDDEYRRFLRQELEAWGTRNARGVRWLRSLDNAAAVARPAITVTLALSGWFVVVHSALNVAAETALGVGIPAGGEALVSVAGEGMTQAAAGLFGRLQTRYADDRARWLAAWLGRELLGDLVAELRRGAETPQSPPFVEAELALAALRP